MKVELIHYSNINDFFEEDPIGLDLMSFNYYIQGVSRSLMIEMTRTRTFSFSIRSSRYTLSKDLKNEEPFTGIEDKERANKYIVLTNNTLVDTYSIQALENIRKLVKENISNDILKYSMPECYKTDIAMTTNFNGLKNFFKLRTSPQALWEIRELSYQMYDVLDNKIKPLFKDVIHQRNNNKE